MASCQSGIPQLDCKYTFIISENADRIDYLYGERGGGGEEGEVLKRRIWEQNGLVIITNIMHIINQYDAHGLSSFIALLISFVSYFKIRKFIIFNLSTLRIFFSLSIHPWETLQNWNIQCKPIGLPTKCSIEFLVVELWKHTLLCPFLGSLCWSVVDFIFPDEPGSVSFVVFVATD